jgi:serine/threonine protein kinase
VHIKTAAGCSGICGVHLSVPVLPSAVYARHVRLLLAVLLHILQVKIADFGLAKQSADAMSTVCGTPQYVAPEVIQGTSGTVYGPAVSIYGPVMGTELASAANNNLMCTMNNLTCTRG